MNEYRKKLLRDNQIFYLHSDIKKFDWFEISKKKLSEEFIIEFRIYLHWKNISIYQELSEEFIREFEKSLLWQFVSSAQKLSDDFLVEFKHKINWNQYFWFQKSPSFAIFKKFITKSDIESLNFVHIEHLSDHQQKEIQRIIDLKYLFQTN